MAEPITDEQRIEVREVLADIGNNWGDYQIAVNAPEWLAAYEAALTQAKREICILQVKTTEDAATETPPAGETATGAGKGDNRMALRIAQDQPTRHDPGALSRGIMLATSALQLALYCECGDKIDRDVARTIALRVVAEYERGRDGGR